MMASVGYFFLLLLWVMALVARASSAPVTSQGEEQDYPDYPMARYDEYPVVVPKRAALLLDRLMVALKNAMEEEDDAASSGASTGPGGISGERGNRANPKPRSLPTASQEDTMGMQRRGHGSIGGQHKGRVYWRCYFNAVTCFRRK